MTGTGVYGSHEATTGTAPGVIGDTMSTAGNAIGVLGRVVPAAPGGFSTAVRGINNGSGGLGIGVWGSQAGSGWGVYGTAGNGIGVLGSAAVAGTGVYGAAGSNGVWADAYGTGSPATGGTAVSAFASAPDGTGLHAENTAATGFGNGIWSRSASKDANGIFGYHDLGTDVPANSCCGRGVWGFNKSTQGGGVVGNAANANWYPINGAGVFGSGAELGVWGYGTGTGTPAAGGYGLYGQATAPGGTGAVGFSGAATGTGVGVSAYSGSATGTALVASVAAGGRAGTFNGPVVVNGNLQVNGTLSKTAGSFKITNPLNSTEWLSHSFVESPDMMNVYNGNVTTNAAGVAVVKLPGYFQALNRDFRYQLTVIGQFAQAIVAKKIQSNRFTIRTDKPNVEVSWQITGIRQDREANAHRIPVISRKTRAELRGMSTSSGSGVPATMRVGSGPAPSRPDTNRPRR